MVGVAFPKGKGVLAVRFNRFDTDGQMLLRVAVQLFTCVWLLVDHLVYSCSVYPTKRWKERKAKAGRGGMKLKTRKKGNLTGKNKTSTDHNIYFSKEITAPGKIRMMIITYFRNKEIINHYVEQHCFFVPLDSDAETSMVFPSLTPAAPPNPGSSDEMFFLLMLRCISARTIWKACSTFVASKADVSMKKSPSFSA